MRLLPVLLIVEGIDRRSGFSVGSGRRSGFSFGVGCRSGFSFSRSLNGCVVFCPSLLPPRCRQSPSSVWFVIELERIVASARRCVHCGCRPSCTVALIPGSARPCRRVTEGCGSSGLWCCKKVKERVGSLAPGGCSGNVSAKCQPSTQEGGLCPTCCVVAISPVPLRIRQQDLVDR